MHCPWFDSIPVALTLSSLVVVVSACPGDDGSAESSGSATDSTSTSSGTDDGSTTGDSADSADSSGTGATMCVDDPSPEVQGSQGQITVQLLNDTEEPAYVLSEWNDCTALDLSRDGETFRLANGFYCGCECPGPPAATYEVMALEPGETHSVLWNGTVQVSYQIREDCGDGSCATETVGNPTALEPGPVTLTIPMYAEAGMFSTEESVGSFQSRCPSAWTFTVDVDFGAGEQMVEVLLSDVMP